MFDEVMSVVNEYMVAVSNKDRKKAREAKRQLSMFMVDEESANNGIHMMWCAEKRRRYAIRRLRRK